MSEQTDLYMRGHSARMAMVEIGQCPQAVSATAVANWAYYGVVLGPHGAGECPKHEEETCDWCRGWAAAERELFNGAKQ